MIVLNKIKTAEKILYLQDLCVIFMGNNKIYQISNLLCLVFTLEVVSQNKKPPRKPEPILF